MSVTESQGATGNTRDAPASLPKGAPAGPGCGASGAAESVPGKPSRPAAGPVGKMPHAASPDPNAPPDLDPAPTPSAATDPGRTAAGGAAGGVAPQGGRAGSGAAAAPSAASSPHRFGLRVYYEDTDLAGIVYYANYFRFIERARTEMIRQAGIDQGRLRDDRGIVFAVRSLTADYLVPARFDDELVVETRLLRLTGARVELSQDVLRGADILFRATVTLAALTLEGRPARMPAELRRLAAG